MVFFKAQKMQRMAEMLRQVQEAIQGEGGELLEVEEDLNRVAQAGGFDMEVARQVDAGTLEAVLSPGQGGSSDRCWLTAEALFLDGLASVARGRDEVARDRLVKARRLYRSLGRDVDLPEEAVLPDERLRRIEELTGPE